MHGMMVLNLKKMREDNITDKCLKFIKKYKGSVPHHDQGTINAVCNEKILVIHPKYNVQSPMFTYTADKIKKMYKIKQYYSQEEIEDAIKNPVFIHFTDGFFNRPWNRNCSHPKKDIYLKRLICNRLSYLYRFDTFFQVQSILFIFKILTNSKYLISPLTFSHLSISFLFFS